MSAGAEWEPFSISKEEYDELIGALKATPPSEIKSHARYAWVRPDFDPSLDHIEVYLVWAMAVCQKHRDNWHAALKNAGVSG